MTKIERLKELIEKVESGHYCADNQGEFIFVDNEMCFESRGWGYLTGYRKMNDELED